MQRNTRWLSLILCVCAPLVTGRAVLAQAQPKTSTTTETRHFQVVSVDGNKVVVKDERGSEEITVPEDFRFDVDGKQVSVAELKPGMKGTATITTTTTVKPVTVTEVRNGTVMQVTGNSIIVRTPEGVRMFSEGDAAARNATILRDGQPIRFTDLRRNDRLTATIVTEHPPQVMTERQVQAKLSSPPAPAAATTPAPTTGTAAPAPRQPAATAPEAAAPAPAPHKKLPKTASQLPAIGLTGLALAFIGLGLTLRRRMV
jgi:hypothetical protein